MFKCPVSLHTPLACLAVENHRVLTFWQAQDSKPERAFVNSALTDYKVTVYTSDVQNAGTDADVSLVMYSASGKQSLCTA